MGRLITNVSDVSVANHRPIGRVLDLAGSQAVRSGKAPNRSPTLRALRLDDVSLPTPSGRRTRSARQCQPAIRRVLTLARDAGLRVNSSDVATFTAQGGQTATVRQSDTGQSTRPDESCACDMRRCLD